ncbi:MAG: hypothetical protein RBT32_00860 [Methanothermobacter sp.]|nr:hypothetical protein [Methanothermobacter tenebrarum]MDX9692682.1 hypothetical protein [Methanothermobacter sp.]
MQLGILLFLVIKSILLKEPDRRNIFWKTYFLSIPRPGTLHLMEPT